VPDNVLGRVATVQRFGYVADPEAVDVKTFVFACSFHPSPVSLQVVRYMRKGGVQMKV
jgi:hypothetical protein